MSEQETNPEIPPGEGGVPLSFDAWADLSARMLDLEPEQRQEVLDEHDLDDQDWTRCDECYCLVLAKDIGQGRMERADSYASKCVVEMERRKAAPAAPAVDPGTSAGTPAPELGAEARIGAPLAADPAHVPSFLQEHVRLAPAVASPPAELVSTAAAFELPTALRTGALPFSQAGALGLVPIEPQPQRSPKTGSETLLLGATLPTEPQPQGSPKTGSETLPLGATLPIASALPFGNTVVAPTRAPAFPRMPLQTYASLCAELAAFPDSRAEVLKKYDVADDAARAGLDHHWETRFDAHPETKAEWQGLVTQYREWLHRQPQA